MRTSAWDVSASLHTLPEEPGRPPCLLLGDGRTATGPVQDHRISARIIETGRYGDHHPVFRARIEAHERGCRLVGHIGCGTLNLQSLIAVALALVGLGITVSAIGTALERDKLIEWLFVLVSIGVTAMFGYLAWILGIERLLPASRLVEIDDLDEELRGVLRGLRE